MREGRKYFLKAGNLKLFVNLNPEITRLTLFSSMFSKCNFLQNRQFQEIAYKGDLYENRQFARSELVEESVATINSIAELADLQVFIIDFNVFSENFPDLLKNLNYNTELANSALSARLIFTSFVAKVKKFIEQFSQKLNLNLMQMINTLNADGVVNNSSNYDFDSLFDLQLSFGNFFTDIFSKSNPYAADALNFRIEPSVDTSSSEAAYTLLIERPKLFIHDYVSFSIRFAPSLLGANYKLNFPIFQSLSANLFNAFNSQNAYFYNGSNLFPAKPSAYSVSQEQALTHCFWFSFKNALNPEKANFKLSDTLTFHSAEDKIGTRGIRTSFDFELLPLSEKINKLSVKAYFEVDNANSQDEKARSDLLSLSSEVPKKAWNHICLFTYAFKAEKIMSDPITTASKNKFGYELYLNDQRYSVTFDLLSLGNKLIAMYPKLFMLNPFLSLQVLWQLKGARSLIDLSANALFSDLKLFKFDANMATRKDANGNSISLPDESVLKNAFFSAKFLKFTKFADDLLLIGSSLDSAAIFETHAKGLSLLSTQSAPHLGGLENYKFESFFNPADANNAVKNYNSIFQLGFPKVVLLENFVNVEVIFEGDFVIKTFQKASLATTLKNFSMKEFDFNENYVELRIFDFERKSEFKKNLDFYDLQFKQKAAFPLANINSSNKPFYHFVVVLEIKSTFDLVSTLKKEIFEFKLFVNYFNFERAKTSSLFINNGISDTLNFDRNYIFSKTLIYPFFAEEAVFHDHENFIRSAYLNSNKIQENYFLCRNYPNSNNAISYFYNLKFNQALDFQQSRNIIYQANLVPFAYSEESNADSQIKFRFTPRQVKKPYSKNTFTFYSLFTFNLNLNHEQQMLKPFQNYFESLFESNKSRIPNSNLKIPYRDANIQIFPSKNYVRALAPECVFFTIKTRDQFNLAKQFSVFSDEPNLQISIFYIKTFKNSATYCIKIEKIGIANQASPPSQFIKVFSFATRTDSAAVLSDADSNVFFYLKFLQIDDLFFNRINDFSGLSRELVFAPQYLDINISIQRAFAENLCFDFTGAFLKNCVLHLKSNLYMGMFDFEYPEANLIKPGINATVSAFAQQQPNLLTFSVANLEDLNTNLSSNIVAIPPPYEDGYTFDFGKVKMNVIKSCLNDQIISLIKTDYRDFYFKNGTGRNNTDIVFSLFESKVVFVFNKFCYNVYIGRFYTVENFDGSVSISRSVIDSDILAIDILKVRSITFEFETQTQEANSTITIKVFFLKV